MTQSWSIDWSHGNATVHGGGAALGRTRFRLDDGRWVEPFHEAPWISTGESVEPGLRNLRGDWPCLPFGRLYRAEDPLLAPWKALAGGTLPAQAGSLADGDALLHGYSAQADWSVVSQTAGQLTLGLDYPADSPVERITRTIRPVAGSPALDVSVEIHARRPCRRPFGFHPNFALRGEPGSFQIRPGPFKFALTHPAEEILATARPNSRFETLAEVPAKAGGSAPFDRLPFADDREDILQLCGIETGMHLVDHHDRVAWDLTWDTARLPSCLLWMSNRGRKIAPWSGRNLCVGIEPIASAFDLGSVIACADNPIAEAGVNTALRLEPGTPFTLGYRIEGHALA